MPVVLQSHVYGAAVAMQASVHVLPPAGACWNVTCAMPRSELAVALSATVPVRGEPGSANDTATVLKSAAVVNVLGALVDTAVKPAPDGCAANGIAASAARARRRRVMPGSPTAPRPTPATARRA